MTAKILIVDDREVNRYLRSEILRKAGYEIVEGSTGRQAIEKSLSEKPDMVLLDIHLPDFGGLEVCRLLKNDKRTADIMILQISASAVEFTDAVLGLEGGADGYLVEPVEPELLVAKVRSLLRLRRTEERLRKSNARLAEFAAAASHDLREPIRGITISAQLLQRKFENQLDDEAQRFIRAVVEGAQRMDTLVSELLAYSEVTSGQQPDEEIVSLEEILNGVLVLNQRRIDSLQAKVIAAPLPQLRGSKIRLTQILQNLIDNSLKYTSQDSNPEIHVAADVQHDYWVMSVRDNGPGFAPEYAEEIFGAFKRLHGKEISGNGLGLAICKAAVEQAGGRMWAESCPGQGSTFYFSWPAAQGEDAHSVTVG